MTRRDMVIASISTSISATTMQWQLNHIFLMDPKAYLKLRMRKLIQAGITVEIHKQRVARRKVKAASRLDWQAIRHMARTGHKRLYTELWMQASTLSNRAQPMNRREHRRRKPWRIIITSLQFWGRAQALIDLPPPRRTSCRAQKPHLSQQVSFRSELESLLVSQTLVARSRVWLLPSNIQRRAQPSKVAQVIPISYKTSALTTVARSQTTKQTRRTLQNVLHMLRNSKHRTILSHYKKQIPRWALGNRCLRCL